MRVALYVRTSTLDNQDPAMQVRELTEYAKVRSWTVAGIYEDRGYTGTNSNRPQLKTLLVDAKIRQFDLILVWKLDRFGRSLRELVTMIQDLADHGVEFCSLKDSLDLSTSQGRLMMHLLAAFAQFESDVIKTRVQAGIEHARSKGIRLGRPKIANDGAIIAARAQGLSYIQIQRKLGVSKGSVYRALNTAAPQSPLKLDPKSSMKAGNSDG